MTVYRSVKMYAWLSFPKYPGTGLILIRFRFHQNRFQLRPRKKSKIETREMIKIKQTKLSKSCDPVFIF